MVLHEDAPPVQRCVVPVWRTICLALLAIVFAAAIAGVVVMGGISAPAIGVMAICVLLFNRRRLLNRPLNLALYTGVLASCSAAVFAWAAVPGVNAADDVRPVGEFVNRHVPAGARLHVCDVRLVKAFPAYHPALFYVRAKINYAMTIYALPADAD